MSAELLRERAARIKLLGLDVDGVLTDGQLVYGKDGEALKVFHVRDGLGIRMVMHFGVEIAVITARRSEVLEARFRDLKIARYVIGQDDKLAAFQRMLGELRLSFEQAAFVGDDVLDLPVLKRVGLAVAVRDAHPLVLGAAHHVTEACGGRGAVREVCDLLLESQRGLERSVDTFLATGLGRGTLEKV